MKLFIDGEEFCSAEILRSSRMKYGALGRLSADDAGQVYLVKVGKGFAFGGSVNGAPAKQYELRDDGLRIAVSPIRERPALVYDMMFDGILPSLDKASTDNG